MEKNIEMKNQLELVSYEQSKKLKEAGFDWETMCHYGSDGIVNGILYSDYLTSKMNHNGLENRSGIDYYSAPTVALALKYFRDAKGIANMVEYFINFDNKIVYSYAFDGGNKMHGNAKEFSTYEEAESALLDKLLKLKL